MSSTGTMRAKIVAVLALVGVQIGTCDIAYAQRRSLALPSKIANNRTTMQLRTSANTGNVVVHRVRDRLVYRPPLYSGDRDFSDNGPEVYVKVHFFIANNRVYRRVYMSAHETSRASHAYFGKYRTFAVGWSPDTVVYVPPPGKKVKALTELGGEKLLVDDTLSGHGPHKYPSLLGNVTVWGDHYGDDVGTYTGVRITFDHNMTILLSDDDFTNRVSIKLPRTLSLRPPHTRGDKDFKGHGPRIRVDAGVHNDETRVWFWVSMQAKETRPDWTTAQGSRSIQIYRAPQAFRIKAVHGKKNWLKIIDYKDYNHDRDTLDRSELGRIHVYGDGPGNDAGIYTRVDFTDINYSVVVELEPITR